MSQYGLNTKVNLNGSINELPIDIYVKIRDLLDQNPADSDWRALVRAVEDSYIIKPAQVEAWSPAVSKGSASDKLLTALNCQGMIIRELRDYLRKLQIDTYNLDLDEYEDIVIKKQPPTDLEVYEGDTLTIEVEATGLPFPKFRWFYCADGEDNFGCLQGRTESTLRLDDVSKSNAGTYSCQIYNCMDPKKTKITDNTVVVVSKNPNPVRKNGLNSPDISFNRCFPEMNGLSSTSPLLQSQLEAQFGGLSTGYSLIVRQPMDITVGMNESFVLSVETQGDPPIFYQWHKNGVRLEGEVNPKLHVSHAVPADFAPYYCVVRNIYKTEQSRIACVQEKYPKHGQENEILIVSQPKSVYVKFGACALFTCEAKCRDPLRYQWFKDGVPLPGENAPEIKLMNIQDRRVEGMYQCEVSVDPNSGSSTPRKLSACAILSVEIPSVRDNVDYHPSGKVALLIGNADYKCETPLQGSTVDVQILTGIFRSLDFQVVSLLNLTKPEIENAVLKFCELVDRNVYVVFYFCGHGIEEYGLSYLMPTDAPNGPTTQHCVCVQYVLDNIQKKEPALIFMILDICRLPPKMRSNCSPVNIEKREVRGNTVFCYATSEGMSAYENKHGGLLIIHLKKSLSKNIGIDALVSELKEEFNTVPKHSKKQLPMLQSNICEPRRSLVDHISRKGKTEIFQQRDLLWHSMWEKPRKQNIQINEIGVVIELDFQAEFANTLSVFVSVVNPGMTDECIAQITNFSAPVSLYGKPILFRRDRSVVTKTVLQDIQKLRDNLTVDVTIKATIGGREQYCCKRVNLGLPLVSKLKLWNQSNNFLPQTREGIEQSEN